MIHYIYRIDFLCGKPGRYYLGKRSYPGKDIYRDPYAGSGSFCYEYYQEFGKFKNKTYTKTIIEVNDTWEINKNREEIIIGDLWKTDSLCMNRCPGGAWSNGFNTRKVIQYDLKGNMLAEFDSITEARDKTNSLNIVPCCLGNPNVRTSGGYIWRYDGDDFDKYPIPEMCYAHPESRKKINQYTLDGKYIKTWNSLKEAAKHYSNSKRGYDWLSEAVDGKCANSWYGFIWRTYDGTTDDIVVNVKTVKHRKVAQYTTDGTLIEIHKNCRQAAIKLKHVNCSANIHKCASGDNRYKTCLGYIWKYIENEYE